MLNILRIYVFAVLALLFLYTLSWELIPGWLCIVNAGAATWNFWLMVLNFIWWLDTDLKQISETAEMSEYFRKVFGKVGGEYDYDFNRNTYYVGQMIENGWMGSYRRKVIIDNNLMGLISRRLEKNVNWNHKSFKDYLSFSVHT